MTLEEYFGDWMRVIDKQEFYNIMNKLLVEYKRKDICPKQADVFKAFNLCPLHNLKVIMLGLDPYPQKGVATGILFGNSTDTTEENYSPSLKIIKDAVIDLHKSHNLITFDPTLESWAKQGILMINSALTVEANNPGSHIMLWRPFISKLFKSLDGYTGVVYVLFGSIAKTFKPYINTRFNTVLEVEHPAYFARTGKEMSSEIFYKISRIVKENYNYQISWYKEENYE